MKKNLAVILVMACVLLVGARSSYADNTVNSDPESLIRNLEKSISEQEKLLNSLRARYARIIAQKKQLSEWIEQEREKLAQKQARASQPQPTVEQKIYPGKDLSESKDELSRIDRELQISLALKEKKKARDTRDINYLSALIKKQKDLCAEIIRLEENIAAEEKLLKQLKESRKLPVSS